MRNSSMSFGNAVEVTLREVIFSVLIVGVLYTIGFFISGAIEKSVAEKQLQYRQAIQIKDSGRELHHACDTDVGYAFVEGDFKTLDPVTWEGLEGEHLSIVRDKEKYTMHTRVETYTVTTGKGRTQTRTRLVHYWTWVLVKRDTKWATKVSFCGNEYGKNTFKYNAVNEEVHITNTGYHTRDRFRYRPKNFRGCIFAELNNGKINGCPAIWKGMTLEEMYKDFTTSYAVMIFWICWVAFMVGAVVMFVVIDNRWLED